MNDIIKDELRHTYKIFTSIWKEYIHNCKQPIERNKLISEKAVVQLWDDYLVCSYITYVSKLTPENNSERRKMSNEEKKHVKAVMYKVDLPLTNQDVPRLPG